MRSEPIRRSLTEPILILGCEKNIFLFLIPTICFCLFIGISQLSSVFSFMIYGLLILAIPVAIIGLRHLARIDSQFFSVYRKNFFYPTVIKGSVHPWTEKRKKP